MSEREWYFDLPAGWSSERQPRSERYTLTMPDRLGSITVDFLQRRFAPGIRGRIALHESKASATFQRRGWHQKLVNDAVNWARKELGAP